VTFIRTRKLAEWITVKVVYDGQMDFLLIGNDPFLDFINTRPVVQGEALELLENGNDLMNLLGRLGLPGTPDLRKSVDEDAQTAVEKARRMREDFRALLYRLFLPNRHSVAEADTELAEANRWLSGLGTPVLVPSGESMSVGYGTKGYLAPLLKSALDLFASPKFSHIRKCSNPNCVLWYVDTTKSQTRRWCSMALCGNVHKAREFRKRHQES
jgi:predicted RNA-binding Zn ribbon-like protein